MLLAADMPLSRDGAAQPHQFSWTRALESPCCAGAVELVLRPREEGGHGFGRLAAALAERVRDESDAPAIEGACDAARKALAAHAPHLREPRGGTARLSGEGGGAGRRRAATSRQRRAGGSAATAALMAKHGVYDW
mmetsp:Transcript_11288/g.37555  ORF Transcript_11288/g.37555 Transcript_11288/m.37555 type:complete len:136 (+) Transcript_11288:348-755(+)